MGNASVHRYFFMIKKDGTPFVPYSVTTNGGVYDVKETENADLKSGYADIVFKLKTRNLAGFLVFNLKTSQAVLSSSTVIRSYFTFLANMVAN